MPSDYIITFADETKTSFVIKPYTANGPEDPGQPSTVPLHSAAVTANTSLVLFGKGMPDYGQDTAKNFVRLLENFANDEEPAYLIEGQMWYRNDTGGLYICIDPLAVAFDDRWNEIAVSGGIVSDLDMGGFKIVNLGNPTNPQDAVTLAYSEASYIRLDGSNTPTTGQLALFGGSAAVPALTFGSDTTKGMYNSGVGEISFSIVGVQKVRFDVNGVTTFSGFATGTLGMALWQTGATTTGVSFPSAGTMAFNVGGFTVADVGPGSTMTIYTPLDMDSHQINNVLDPTGPQDAVTVAYADANYTGIGAPGAGSLIGVSVSTTTPTSLIFDYDRQALSSLSLDVTTGVQGLIHTTPNITHPLSDLSDPFSTLETDLSFLREAFVSNSGFPDDVPFNEMVTAMDVAMYALTAPVPRQLFLGNGVTTIFPLDFSYITENNQLSVYVNGIKQYANDKGSWAIKVHPAMNIASDTGLLSSTAYDFRITVDGGSETTVTITPVTAPVTWKALTSLISDAIASDFTITAEVTYQSNQIVFWSDSSGASSSVFVRDGSGADPLFAALTATGASLAASTQAGDNFFFNISAADIAEMAPGMAVVQTGRSGYQDVDFTSPKTDNDTTGLAAATIYTADITIDGNLIPISINTSIDSVSTFQLLCITISLQIMTYGIAYMVGGDLRVSSFTDTATSTVSIIDTGGNPLFSSLTDYSAILAAVAGTSTTTDVPTNTIITSVATSSFTVNQLLALSLPLTFTIPAVTSFPYGGKTVVSITSSSNGGSTFTVPAAYDPYFTLGNTFIVYGSTSNDAAYTITVSSAGGTFTVTPAPATGGADGYIYFTRTLDYAEDGAPFSLSLPGTAIEFTVAPLALDDIEVVVAR